MDLSGWIQLALFLGLLSRRSPSRSGLYLVRVLEPDGQDLSRPAAQARRTAVLPDPRRRSGRGTGLEAVHAFPPRLQPGRAAVHLRHPPAPAPPAAQPAGASGRSGRTWPSTRRSASRPTPTGRTTREKRPCPISRRWSASSSITSSRPPPASPWPRPSSAASPGIRPRPSATSGSTSSGSISICCFRSALVFALFLVSQGVDPELQAL